MVLADLLTQLVTTITDVVPDFEVYIAAGIVVSLAAYTVRRFLGAGL